jgi:hypothetical protein
MAAINQPGVAMSQILPTQRQDARSREIVDIGIAVQQRGGTMPAVEYLRSQHIAAAVIARVLGEPQHRRAPAA